MKPEKINREKMRNPEKNISILMMFYLKKINLSWSFKNKDKKIKIKLFIYFKLKASLSIISYWIYVLKIYGKKGKNLWKKSNFFDLWLIFYFYFYLEKVNWYKLLKFSNVQSERKTLSKNRKHSYQIWFFWFGPKSLEPFTEESINNLERIRLNRSLWTRGMMLKNLSGRNEEGLISILN